MNKKREYHKKLISLRQTVRTKLLETYRGINVCKKGYQPRSNLVKDENDDLLADLHNISNRGKNYFCELLSVHGFNGVR
jgi:hypothetical protein